MVSDEEDEQQPLVAPSANTSRRRLPAAVAGTGRSQPPTFGSGFGTGSQQVSGGWGARR